jgi:RepB DNA-primase from phage plasmid
MSQAATTFLTRCFDPGDTIAFLLRSETAEQPAQRIVRLEQALAPTYLRWLTYENRSGANIYVAANPLRLGSRRRTKDSIASIRHLYIDIDSDGDARLATLRASDTVPSPSVILATSPGKFQALWRVDGFHFQQQEATLKQLAIAFGGDPACTDCNRVLRVPGFLNRKYSPAHPVTAEYLSDSVWNPTDFHLDVSILVSRGIAMHSPISKHSHSESDWSWVLAQLEHGNDAEVITNSLAGRRADKPNPLYYAQRTVDMATARLLLLKGMPIADVVALLEDRRRQEIPAALCFARAREIATTAERMISRKKFA